MNGGFLLDTNVLSELARPRVEPRVQKWVASQNFGTLFISVVTLGEMEKGFTTMRDLPRRARLKEWLEHKLAELFQDQALPVTREIARRWGAFDGMRQAIGRPLGPPDGMIAATAFVHGLTLVTRNVKDFESLGVTILNPWD